MRLLEKLLWRLVVVVVALQCCCGVMVPMSDDVMGLMSFKAGLQDPNGALRSWREDDTSPCAWAGVTCDRATGRLAFVHWNVESSYGLGCFLLLVYVSGT
jgi:hypothetical protein